MDAARRQWAMLLSLLVALSFQTAPSLATPGIVLILSSDTAFVAPTNSIGREGNVRSATLVQIFPLGSEGWETVRQDIDLEIDCEGRRVRMIGSRSLDAAGQAIPGDVPESTDWEPLPDDYPPMATLHAVTCSDLDLSTVSSADLEAELPRLRARLQ
jgi:hypothetical protein